MNKKLVGGIISAVVSTIALFSQYAIPPSTPTTPETPTWHLFFVSQTILDGTFNGSVPFQLNTSVFLLPTARQYENGSMWLHNITLEYDAKNDVTIAFRPQNVSVQYNLLTVRGEGAKDIRQLLESVVDDLVSKKYLEKGEILKGRLVFSDEITVCIHIVLGQEVLK